MMNKKSHSSSKGKSRRLEILSAAISVFAQFGEQNTTFRDVARACGVTSQAIYHYFPDKRTLFVEAISEAQSRFLEELEEKIKGVPFPYLTGYYNQMVTECLEKHPLVMAVAKSGIHRDIELMLRVRGSEENQLAFVREVELAQSAGIVRQDIDAVAVARAAHRLGVRVYLPLLSDPELMKSEWPDNEVLILSALFPNAPNLQDIEERMEWGVRLHQKLIDVWNHRNDDSGN